MQRWARFIGRTRWGWIVFWPTIAAGIWTAAPRIPTLLADDDTGFLPANTPSRIAFARLRDEFPAHAPASRAVIVFARAHGLTDDDRRQMGGLARALDARSETLGWRVHATATNPLSRSLLESNDGQAGVIAVDLPAEMLTHSTVNRVREIQRAVARTAPKPGLRVEITGSGALGELLDANAKRDVDRTTIWAFVAVATILLVIYRSPVAMFLPLVTIAVSLMVALGVIGWAASAGWPINGLVEMFVVVILVGSGVDYCLFLFARFREERANQPDAAKAVEIAVTRTVGAVLASAGTNAAALATLALAANRDLYTSGPTIALAIGIATLAVLTLTPSLMQVVGDRLFLPPSATHYKPSDDRAWAWVARATTRHPVRVALLTVGVLLPPAVLSLGLDPLFDATEEFPTASSLVRGARLYEEHFFASGSACELTLLISADERLDANDTLPALRSALDDVDRAVRERFPVAYLRDLQDPLGTQRKGSGARIATIMPTIAAGLADHFARAFYIGRTGTTTRVDLALRIPPRSIKAMDMVAELRQTVRDALNRGPLRDVGGAAKLRVDVAGETATYADIRAVRRSDFKIVAMAAVAVVYLILLWLLRAPLQAAILMSATLLTYLATYGLTWLLVTRVANVSGLSYQIDFLLFIIILALGQDYNIYVVTRIHEELRKAMPQRAVAAAVTRTGRVVSSCGLIMAAAFASMSTGSLLVMKEFAVALAMGILMDTFVIRPLLVPSALLILFKFRPGGADASMQSSVVAIPRQQHPPPSDVKDQHHVGPSLS